MKKFILKHWSSLLLLTLMIVSCILNITFSCITNTHANLFTALSGWVSGIATIILGLIAVWQSKQYKEHNDKNNILINLKTEFTCMDELYNKFIEKFDSAVLIYNIDKYHSTHSNMYLDNVAYFQINLSKVEAQIIMKIATQTYYKKSNLSKFMTEYYEIIKKADHIFNDQIIKQSEMNSFIDTFEKVVTEFKLYLSNFGEFYNRCLSDSLSNINKNLNNMKKEQSTAYRYIKAVEQQDAKI